MGNIKIYNTFTKEKEDFIPLEDKKVKMYACGITASGDAHLGHAYQSIIFDVINKYFKYKGFDIHYVRNYTDVDDKIIAKANQIGKNAIDYANEVIKDTDDVLQRLGNATDIHVVKVSDNIDEIINFVQALIEKGYAYPDGQGNVYFKVDKFKNYGKLSNIDVDMNYTAVRKDIIGEKENTLDFALWKSAKPGEIFFESPFGKGRPGWHIECSAMARRYLGDQIDIHGGGRDLIFPHHENEIAQSEALTDKKMANYWIHNGLVKINGEKMAKSLGNGITIKDALNMYHREVIRYTLLQTSYNSDINIVSGIFETVESKLYDFYKTLDLIDSKIYNNIDINITNEYINKLVIDFENAMDNNFNASLAIANLYDIFSFLNKEVIKETNYDLKLIKNKLLELYSILGIFTENTKEFISKIKDKYLLKNNMTIDEINKLINERNEFKLNKDYAKSDEIRDLLKSKGIIIKDKSGITDWDVVVE